MRSVLPDIGKSQEKKRPAGEARQQAPGSPGRIGDSQWKKL